MKTWLESAAVKTYENFLCAFFATWPLLYLLSYCDIKINLWENIRWRCGICFCGRKWTKNFHAILICVGESCDFVGMFCHISFRTWHSKSPWNMAWCVKERTNPKLALNIYIFKGQFISNCSCGTLQKYLILLTLPKSWQEKLICRCGYACVIAMKTLLLSLLLCSYSEINKYENSTKFNLICYKSFITVDCSCR
jgi:hypothetical protein